MKNIFRVLNTVLTISFLTLTYKGFSQVPTFTWGKKFSANSSAIPRSVFVDASGNVYSVGGYGGTTDFDPGVGVFNLTSNGSSDIFITKLDAAGNFVWAKAVGGSGDDQAKGVAVDASGNVYLTGYYSSVTVDFDPNAGIFNMTNAGGQDIFILKLDINGNFVWAKKFGNASGAEEGTGIALDASNNVYTTGIFFGTMDFDPNAGVFNLSPTSTALYVSKLDVNGNFIFARECSGNSGVQGMAIKLDGSGNIYTTGVFSGTDDFDPGIGVNNVTSFGSNDVFVLKLDASGNFVFVKQIGGTSADDAWTIDIDNASNIIIGGDFQGTADFDPGVGTFNITSTGSYDAYVCKLNSTGNFVWSKSLGGVGTERVFSLGTDILNNVYSVGQFQNTVDFDPGAGVYNLTASVGLDGFINKLDALGNFVWTGQIGGTSSEMIQCMRIDQNSNLHFGGQFTGTTDLDVGVGSFTITASNNDAFLCKYAACTIPSQPGTILGATTICSGSSNNYSVSAVAGATSYTWNLPVGWSGVGTSNTINPTAGNSGTISVSGVNSCGTGAAQTISVLVNPLPTINASSTTSLLCVGYTATLTASGASSYTWNPGGIGTSIFVSPTVTTTYSIVGTSTAGCNNSSSFTQSVSTCVGLSSVSLAKQEISIYPIPFSNSLTIISNEINQPILIYNALGSIVYSSTIQNAKAEINLSNQAAGIYYLKIGLSIKKIIKE